MAYTGKNYVEHQAWENMKLRCYYPRHESYERYGALGIKVCRRWLQSFKNFIEDMGPKPGPEYSLDRIDSKGNYEPGNCKWSTLSDQLRNRKRWSRFRQPDLFV
jgi:hypothetical protein